MPKLTKRANRDELTDRLTDGQTDPNYRKCSLLIFNISMDLVNSYCTPNISFETLEHST